MGEERVRSRYYRPQDQITTAGRNWAENRRKVQKIETKSQKTKSGVQKTDVGEVPEDEM